MDRLLSCQCYHSALGCVQRIRIYNKNVHVYFLLCSWSLAMAARVDCGDMAPNCHWHPPPACPLSPHLHLRWVTSFSQIYTPSVDWICVSSISIRRLSPLATDWALFLREKSVFAQTFYSSLHQMPYSQFFSVVNVKSILSLNQMKIASTSNSFEQLYLGWQFASVSF